METEEDEKINMVKQFLEGYLLDYEQYCFEEAWKDIRSLSFIPFSMIKKGI